MTTDIGELRRKARALMPMLRIGKAGLSEGMLNEIRLQLKKKKMIKIKILKSALEGKTKEEMIREMVDKTGVRMVSNAGYMVVLYKENTK